MGIKPSIVASIGSFIRLVLNLRQLNEGAILVGHSNIAKWCNTRECLPEASALYGPEIWAQSERLTGKGTGLPYKLYPNLPICLSEFPNSIVFH